MTDRPEALPADQKAPPFDYNPSSMSQRIPIAVLGLFAALIAFYMGAFQWGWIDSVWDPVFGSGSETVLTGRVRTSLKGTLG